MDASCVDHESGGNDGTGNAKLAAKQDFAVTERMFKRTNRGLDGRTQIAEVLRQGMEVLAFECETNLAVIEIEGRLLVGALGSDRATGEEGTGVAGVSIGTTNVTALGSARFQCKSLALWAGGLQRNIILGKLEEKIGNADLVGVWLAATDGGLDMRNVMFVKEWIHVRTVVAAIGTDGVNVSTVG